MSAYRSMWDHCRFVDCKMSLADLSISRIFDSEFVSCTIMVGNFTRAEIRRSKFSGCDMEQAIFSGAVIEATDFDRCRLSYSRFDEATIRDVTFWKTNLHGADLRYTECHRANYNDSVLWGAGVSMGCQFFNAVFDERSANLFAAIVGKIHPNLATAERIKELAGADANKAIERLMRDKPE